MRASILVQGAVPFDSHEAMDALMVLPIALVSTYTTATVGGYGRILLLGNLTLLRGHAMITDRPRDWRAWLGLGAPGNLRSCTMTLVGIYLLPVRVLLLAERLGTIGIEFAEKGIGSYRVPDYLPRGMTPQELGFGP